MQEENITYNDMMEDGAIAHGLGCKDGFFNWVCDCCKVVIGFADFTEIEESNIVICEDCLTPGDE